MRVLFVDHAGHAAGAAVSMRYLAGGLHDRGHDVHVAQLHPAPAINEFYRSAGLTLHDLQGLPTVSHTTAAWLTLSKPRGLIAAARGAMRYSAAASRLRALVERIKPDIVHLNSATLALAAYALRKTNARVVWHVRESPPFDGVGVRTRCLARMMTKYSAATIFISNHDRDQWTSGSFGDVVYCCTPTEGSDAGVASSELRKSLGLDDKAAVILFVGGFQEIKGFQPLVRAFEMVAARVPNVRLLILGADDPPPASKLSAIARRYGPLIGLYPYHAECRRLIETSPACGKIHVMPLVGNVRDYLAICDFLVFPSVRAHFARPVIEAALAGRASVASRFGGIEEVVRDGETAMLVPPGDIQALAQAMASLLVEPNRANCMGDKARAYAEGRYSINGHVDSVCAIYHRVMAGNDEQFGGRCQP